MPTQFSCIILLNTYESKHQSSQTLRSAVIVDRGTSENMKIFLWKPSGEASVPGRMVTYAMKRRNVHVQEKDTLIDWLSTAGMLDAKEARKSREISGPLELCCLADSLEDMALELLDSPTPRSPSGLFFAFTFPYIKRKFMIWISSAIESSTSLGISIALLMGSDENIDQLPGYKLWWVSIHVAQTRIVIMGQSPFMNHGQWGVSDSHRSLDLLLPG